MVEEQEEEGEVVCANPDCQVAQDQKCVEGLELGSCPHYGHAPSDEVEEDEEIDEEAISHSVSLTGAGTLTTQEVARLLRAGPARVISVIGPFKAGKTSLIASLYDLFQEGQVDGIEFARSRSLHGFELACHDARAASRRGVPDQERTKRGEVRFYHLDVGVGAAGDVLTLAIGDRSGEEYRDATDDTSLATSFPEVRRADSLALLIDGERLLDAGARHNLRSQTKMILQALVDGEAVKAGQRLALVLTKIDLVQVSADKGRVEKDFENLIAQIKQLYSGVFSTVESFKVAASPSSDVVERGAGVAELLSFWVEPTPSPSTVPPPRPNFERVFARLQPLDKPEPGNE